MSKKKMRPSPSNLPTRSPADQAEATGTVPPAPDAVVELDRAIRTEQIIRRANDIREGDAE
jgi:hypothetical protein